jgi:sialate O-acetylesterase
MTPRSIRSTPWLFVLLCATSAPVHAAEAPLLHPMFQDHAVLQRDAPIRVYGHAAPDEGVTITLAGRQSHAKADADGHWEALLPALAAGGPYTLTARATGGRQQLAADILVGDVWLCSGQSNMVLQVHRALDARSEIAGSSNDAIRMLTIGETGSVSPLDAFATPVQWSKASPENTPNFSATCFYFARELRKSVDVPMGLVVAAWGGSRIQAWISAASLRTLGTLDRELDVLTQYASDAEAGTAAWGELWETWWRGRPGVAAGDLPWKSTRAEGEWLVAPTALGAWERWSVPQLADFNGMLWYRTSVVLSAKQAAQDAVLAIGAADEVDITWINGRSVGSSYGADAAREYRVPRGVLRAGENLVVVNVLDTYKDGGLVGSADARSIRFADGSSVPLDGEWRYRIVPASAGTPPRAPWHTAAGLSTLYNGMIAPIGRYGVRGFVWYQGESNTGEAALYGDMLHTLLRDWRGHFGADLPMLNVQLANYGPARSQPSESGWAELREAQRRYAERDPHYGIAVAVDIGDRYDIHPSNKQEVGRRLARLARHDVYGETSLPPSGPTPSAARRDGDAVVVRFADVTGALVAYGADGPIGFELCGKASGSCRYANAQIRGNDVVLRASLGTPATRVRYGWADSPVVTLFDGAGLPAGPFELAISDP